MEWISVIKDLPVISTAVLVWAPEYILKVRIGYYDPVHGSSENQWIDGNYISMRVTHWMPLPNSPVSSD